MPSTPPCVCRIAVIVAAALVAACTSPQTAQTITEAQVRPISSGGFCGSPEPAITPVTGIPGVNPGQEAAFRIDLGQRPSGGYKLELVPGARLSYGRLTLPVRVRAPAPNSPQTAVLSQPCLVVAVKHEEALRSVRVVSTDGAMPSVSWP